ncbi:MAG: hypothetical protein LC640_04895, partial [Frankia sp.]|nr:hypothetical protein [Frankia sp.]
VLESVARPTRTVNVKASNNEIVTVTYSCVGVKAGRYSSLLDAYLGRRVIASQRTDVTCQPAPRIPVLPIVLLPAPPPAALPAPPGQPNAPVQSNPNPNPQAQANVQAAAAEQEQEQAQLATVGQEGDDEEDEEYAMSALGERERDNGAAAVAAVVAAGLLSAGCAGFGLARQRVRPATVPVRYR